MAVDITIRVPNKEVADIFFAWFLDGGGDQDFESSLEDRGIEPGSSTWDLEKKLIVYEETTSESLYPE